MRQSTWLKRLDFDVTRPEIAQSSSQAVDCGVCSCQRTKQRIRSQMSQLPAMRRELGYGADSWLGLLARIIHDDWSRNRGAAS
jgi:hypothetical protein